MSLDLWKFNRGDCISDGRDILIVCSLLSDHVNREYVYGVKSAYDGDDVFYVHSADIEPNFHTLARIVSVAE